MHYLFASKPGVDDRLVATFDSEQQLLSYVRWATLSEEGGHSKFEQGSALAGYRSWSRTSDDETADHNDVPHNPSPSML